MMQKSANLEEIRDKNGKLVAAKLLPKFLKGRLSYQGKKFPPFFNFIFTQLHGYAHGGEVK